jgi:hypothetical protein
MMVILKNVESESGTLHLFPNGGRRKLETSHTAAVERPICQTSNAQGTDIMDTKSCDNLVVDNWKSVIFW